MDDYVGQAWRFRLKGTDSSTCDLIVFNSNKKHVPRAFSPSTALVFIHFHSCFCSRPLSPPSIYIYIFLLPSNLDQPLIIIIIIVLLLLRSLSLSARSARNLTGRHNMRRNCNLELRLFPSFETRHLHETSTEQDSESPQENLQKLTIFYDGKMCTCDVTEFQAKSILMLANREMKERAGTPNGSEPSSPNTVPLYSPSSGLSMKRSLQNFLQKRKNRILEGSPYHH